MFVVGPGRSLCDIVSPIHCHTVFLTATVEFLWDFNLVPIIRIFYIYPFCEVTDYSEFPGRINPNIKLLWGIIDFTVPFFPVILGQSVKYEIIVKKERKTFKAEFY